MAALTGLPNLSSTSSGSSSSQSGSSSSQSQTATTSSGSSSSTGSSSSGSSSNSGSTTNSATLASSATLSSSISGLSALPTLAGAGIPVLEIPYTANAPFMQKSDMPEGTVFIAVGAVLAFLGACVLLWRGLIAWSINRSVRRAAIASMGSSEKASAYWGGSSKNGTYTEISGSNMSLDALTSSGKPIRSNYKDDHRSRPESHTPAGLFFSPTAQAANNSNPNLASRTSSYLPAGYYASPSSHAAGGAGATTIGGSLAPYARHSTVEPSPPASPNLAPTSRGSATYARAPSRDATSRDGLKPGSRDSYRGQSSGYYNQPSSSSLMVGGNDMAGQRAPSAYLEDLFENHGNGPRERF